jgi:N6-adenosine-specific RNA methylase IME4
MGPPWPRKGHYRVIYADPPWAFATYSGKGKGRSADAHYDCMDLEAIKRLPVAEWAAEDAVLLLWATDPLLDRALEVARAWGFAYKTVGFYWVKRNAGGEGFFTGLGFWTRANPEQCLLATRGCSWGCRRFHAGPLLQRLRPAVKPARSNMPPSRDRKSLLSQGFVRCRT